MSISGSGKAAAFSLHSDNVTVNISGSGRAEVTANELLDVVISGSGEVHYRGNPDLVSQQVSGSGKVLKK